MLVAGSSLTSGYGKYMTGSLFFNGSCVVTAQNVNGGINGRYANSTATGTYAAAPNNSIAMTLRLPGQSQVQTFTLGVSTTAVGGFGLETDGTAVATISLKPQSLPIGGYTPAMLKGTFQLSCIGTDDSYSDMNTMSFDGAGGVTGVDVYNNEGSQGSAPITGTYTVAGDGTFMAVLRNNFAGYSLTGVLTRNANYMDYTYDVDGTGGVAACSGQD
jgi:hypothetical protein